MTSPTATSLKAVWLLSVSVLLAGSTFEVCDLNDLYPSQRFLLVGLQATFALWALVELIVLRAREHTVPLTALLIVLVVQMLITVVRVPVGRWLISLGWPARLDFGLAQIFVPLYAVTLLAASKLLIDAFSFTERQRSAMLRAENETRVRTEEALRAANAELQRINATDSLTGVHSRGHFMQALQAEAQRSRRWGRPVSLVMIDLDRFKTINDTHGHPVGDAVLVELARRIQDSLRSTDLLARMGGEEFAVVLPGVDRVRAAEIAERLRELVAGEPFPAAGRVTASFGAAQLGPEDSVEDWLRAADAGTYAAKRSGRNRVAVAGGS